MSDLFSEGSAPLPPRRLDSPVEIISHLRGLMASRAALELRFTGRQHVFQSYIVAVDRENNRIALDELIPHSGERSLLNGEAIDIVTYRDGVRITWSHSQQGLPDTINGSHCYWLTLPTQIHYHQRRHAFRANTPPAQILDVQINSRKLAKTLNGHLLDISATGCKICIKSSSTPLQLGQLYESFTINLPTRAITLSAELRHFSSDESSASTLAGFKFHDLSGATQRIIERFVYQLQREARRKDDALF